MIHKVIHTLDVFISIYGFLICCELTKVNKILALLLAYSHRMFFIYCMMIFMLFDNTNVNTDHSHHRYNEEKQILIDILFSYHIWFISLLTTVFYMICYFIIKT